MPNLKWGPILRRAAKLVTEHGSAVTLRQLFYLLVSESFIPNSESAYKTLSKQTAQYRREGIFPALIDSTRKIHLPVTFDGPAEAYEYLAAIYMRDRTEGQEYDLWLGAEKSTMLVQLQQWFGDMGVPIVPLRGYSSETLESEVIDEIQSLHREGRPSVLIYAGDFDASGMDISRNFKSRVGVFAGVERICVNLDDIDTYALTVQRGKPKDSRALAFVQRYGLRELFGDRFTYSGYPELDGLIQVEVEALPPEDLRDLYAEAIARYWDTSTFDKVMAQETRECRAIQAHTR
jgi:hypothetical protein